MGNQQPRPEQGKVQRLSGLQAIGKYSGGHLSATAYGGDIVCALQKCKETRNEFHGLANR